MVWRSDCDRGPLRFYKDVMCSGMQRFFFKLPQPFDRGVSQYKVTVQRVAASLQSCHSLLWRLYKPTTVYEPTTKCCGISTKLPQRVAALILQSCHSVMPCFFEAATASCHVSTKLPQRVAAFLQSCHCMLRHF